MNKIDVESRIARPSMRVDPAATCQQGVGSSSISDAAVFPAPPVDATGIRDFEGADVGRLPVAGQYPPRRTPEMNRRIAAHEVGGHGFLARALGNSVLYCTILPGGGFEGRCVRAGQPSQHNLDVNREGETAEIVDVCSRLEGLTPVLGTGRVESAEFYIRAQGLIVELVGGRVAERILFPDHPPLRAEHDQVEARAFASVACASPRAASALIAYAEAEAECLIRENLSVVTALVDAMVERGTMTGEEIDAVIGSSMARETQRSEIERRARWRSAEQNAASFTAQYKD